MKACLLRSPAPLEKNPLEFADTPTPAPKGDEVLVSVRACGVCRTDLHVVEGELAPRKSPVIPGHQAVGIVEKLGPNAGRLSAVGGRVGVPWLHRTCGACEFCRTGRENLCDTAAFTGWTADGGYAEYVVAPEAFVYPIPDGFGDLEAAPLLCAGIIGFRCLRTCALQAGQTLGMYGFGAAAMIAIQVARHWGLRVFVYTRDAKHQEQARELGAEWAGTAAQKAPSKLDAAIIFAPAGQLVIDAMKVLKKGGSVVMGGIHSTPIPQIEYPLIYDERVLRSVANNTRRDGEDFLRIAAEIPVRTEIKLYPLSEANTALQEHKRGAIRGTAVLQI
jgi:propanol-preferring alcohol dehydrogenase